MALSGKGGGGIEKTECGRFVSKKGGGGDRNDHFGEKKGNGGCRVVLFSWVGAGSPRQNPVKRVGKRNEIGKIRNKEPKKKKPAPFLQDSQKKKEGNHAVQAC